MEKLRQMKMIYKDIFFIILVVVILMIYNCISQKYNSFSVSSTFSIFSIQSSVSILGIAILSLLSGSLNDSYLGMKISTYFTSKHSRIFTSNSIMFVQLILIVLSIFFIRVKLYELIPIMMIVSVLLTLRHILLVVGVYRGFEYIRECIEVYYIDLLLKANNNDFFEIIESIEKSISSSSFTYVDINYETLLSFFIKIQDKVVGKRSEPVLQIVEKSILIILKNAQERNSRWSYISLMEILSQSIKIYTRESIQCHNYAINLYGSLNEFMRNSNDVNLTNSQIILTYYESYISNVTKNHTIELPCYELETSSILIKYLYDVYIINPNHSSKIKEKNKAFIDQVLWSYHQDKIPINTLRDLIVLLLQISDDLLRINKLFSKLVDYERIDDSLIQVLMLLILFYQIILYEDPNDLRDASIKDRTKEFLIGNRDISGVLYSMVFNSRMLEMLNVDKVERFLSNWVHSFSSDVENREYSHYKVTDEFLVILFTLSAYSAQEISDILTVKEVSSISLDGIFSDDKIIFKKLSIFNDLLLRGNEITDDDVNKLRNIITLMSKAQFVLRHTLVNKKDIVDYRREKAILMQNRLERKLNPIAGFIDKKKKIKTYKYIRYDNLVDNSRIFESLILKSIETSFLNHLYQECLFPKVVTKQVNEDRKVALNNIMKELKKYTSLEINTLFGYKRKFYSYGGSDIFEKYLTNIQTRFETEVGHNILCFLDRSKFKVKIVGVEISIQEASIEEYLKLRRYTINTEGIYMIDIGTQTTVNFTENELENFVRSNINKIEYTISYLFQSEKKPIGVLYIFKS